MIGTRQFMSPEIFKSDGAPNSYTDKSDMWSLGVIMYLLIFGFYPFDVKMIRDENKTIQQ